MADVFLKGKFHSLTSENRHVTYKAHMLCEVFFCVIANSKSTSCSLWGEYFGEV